MYVSKFECSSMIQVRPTEHAEVHEADGFENGSKSGNNSQQSLIAKMHKVNIHLLFLRQTRK